MNRYSNPNRDLGDPDFRHVIKKLDKIKGNFEYRAIQFQKGMEDGICSDSWCIYRSNVYQYEKEFPGYHITDINHVRDLYENAKNRTFTDYMIKDLTGNWLIVKEGDWIIVYPENPFLDITDEKYKDKMIVLTDSQYQKFLSR